MYREEDLGFPGVVGMEVAAMSQGSSQVNTLFTFMAHGSNPRGENSAVPLLDHRPYLLTITISTQFPAPQPAVVRVFLLCWPRSDQRLLPIQLDMFRTEVGPGVTRLTRHWDQSPHLAGPGMDMATLQERLLQGSMDWEQFSDAGCGWPHHLHLPRGGRGAGWRLVVLVSPPGPADHDDWGRGSAGWGMCGARQGGLPDSRPLGFPLDRPVVLDSVEGQASRPNWAFVPVDIIHENDFV